MGTRNQASGIGALMMTGRRKLLELLPASALVVAVPAIALGGEGGGGGGDGGDGGGGGASSGSGSPNAQIASAASVNAVMGDQGERVIIIDVRPKGDFARGHLRGAINLQVRYSEVTRSYQFDKSALGSDKSRRVIVYGANANDRSAIDAVRAMTSEGYTNVMWLRGGFAEWVAARLPTATS